MLKVAQLRFTSMCLGNTRPLLPPQMLIATWLANDYEYLEVEGDKQALAGSVWSAVGLYALTALGCGGCWGCTVCRRSPRSTSRGEYLPTERTSAIDMTSMTSPVPGSAAGSARSGGRGSHGTALMTPPTSPGHIELQ